MKTFLKVALFSVLVVLAFGGYSNFGIPVITPAPPPVQEKLDLGAMTMDQFVALGEKIYKGKGTCTLCHNDLGRAPMLNKLATSLAVVLKDPRYKGLADGSNEKYLVESLVKPSAFVAAGFGKAGSNDTESPMPDVSGGAIGLTKAEVMAVVAYLLDSNGLENTVEIPKETPAASSEAAASGKAEPRKPHADGAAVAQALGCGMCHKLGDQTGEAGPDLTTIGAKQNREYLRRAILNPNADLAEGYPPDMMPADYGIQVYATELELLVDYLASQK